MNQTNKPGAGAGDLSSLFGAIPKLEHRTADIDVSHLAGAPAGTLVLTFREPDTKLRFLAVDEGEKEAKRRPGWTRNLGAAVMLVAACHVAPDPPKGEIVRNYYVQLIENGKGHIFDYLLEQLNDAFPQPEFKAALNEAKNASPAQSEA